MITGISAKIITINQNDIFLAKEKIIGIPRAVDEMHITFSKSFPITTYNDFMPVLLTPLRYGIRPSALVYII